MMAVLLSCCSYLSLLHCSIARVSLVCWNRHRCLARHRRRLRVLACDWLSAKQWQPLVAAVVRTNNFDRESNADADEHRDDGEEDGDDGVELELGPLQSTGDCAKESRLVSMSTSDWYCWFHRHKYHYRLNPHGENDADENDDGDGDDDR